MHRIVLDRRTGMLSKWCGLKGVLVGMPQQLTMALYLCARVLSCTRATLRVRLRISCSVLVGMSLLLSQDGMPCVFAWKAAHERAHTSAQRSMLHTTTAAAMLSVVGLAYFLSKA